MEYLFNSVKDELMFRVCVCVCVCVCGAYVAAGPKSLLKSPILGGNFGFFRPLLDSSDPFSNIGTPPHLDAGRGCGSGEDGKEGDENRAEDSLVYVCEWRHDACHHERVL